MLKRILFYIFISIIISLSVNARQNKLILATTTSTYDTGFLNYINKIYEKKNNINIHVISLGTGQALEIGKNGDADVLLVHHKPSEIKFLNDGYGSLRYDLMYNDYVIIGPKNNKKKCSSIKNFLKYIIENKLLFISRSDGSGTHKKEEELWTSNSLNPEINRNRYLKIGQGMGATLMMANEMNAYTLSDRATWINYKNKTNLDIICQDEPPLKNQYGIIAVNPNISENINFKNAIKYINWLISDEGGQLINSFRKNNQQLFYFNYK